MEGASFETGCAMKSVQDGPEMVYMYKNWMDESQLKNKILTHFYLRPPP
jgi:hypothetical protein